MGRVRLDGAVDTRSDRVMLDELEERHQLVDGLAALRCRSLALLAAGRRGRGLRRRVVGLVGLIRLATGRRRLGHGHRLHRSSAGLAAAATAALVAVLLRGASRTATRRTGRLAADRATNRDPIDEHPAHVWHRLPADQAPLVEEPFVVPVELLERVVGEDRGVRLLGDAQHECVAAADRAGGWCDEFVVGDALFELLGFLLVDAVAEGGVDHDGDRRVRVLVHERHHRLVQLGEARQRAPFGGDVGPVDHDVAGPLG